jgi:hypothetical protein
MTSKKLGNETFIGGAKLTDVKAYGDIVVPLEDVKILAWNVSRICKGQNISILTEIDIDAEFRFLLESETFPNKVVPYKKINLKERDEKLKQQLACCKAELWNFLSDGCLDIADEDFFSDIQRKEIIRKVFAEASKAEVSAEAEVDKP